MRRPARSPQGLLGARDGAAAVEFGLIMPLLFLCLLGVMEVGRALWTLAGLNFAVQEAARCGVVRAATPPGGGAALCGDAASTAAFAASKAPALQLTAANFTVTNQACGVQVQGHVAYQFLVWKVFPSAPTITAQACHA